MNSIQIHKVIGLIISFFYRIGFWHHGDKPTVKEIRLKIFYAIYHLLFFLSLLVGAIINKERDQSIFLLEIAIGVAIVGFNLWLLLTKQNEILNLLNRVCVFSIRHDDDYSRFNDRVSGFMKFVLVFLTTLSVTGFSASIVMTLIGDEKTLFVEIAFPLDYKNNEIALWIATIFLFTGILLTIFIVIFFVIIWYLLLICALRYEILGSELKTMGRVLDPVSEDVNEEITEKQMQDQYLGDLKVSIDAYAHQRECVIVLQ